VCVCAFVSSSFFLVLSWTIISVFWLSSAFTPSLSHHLSLFLSDWSPMVGMSVSAPQLRGVPSSATPLTLIQLAVEHTATM
jgi:hypothetical protein